MLTSIKIAIEQYKTNLYKCSNVELESLYIILRILSWRTIDSLIYFSAIKHPEEWTIFELRLKECFKKEN